LVEAAERRKKEEKKPAPKKRRAGPPCCLELGVEMYWELEWKQREGIQNRKEKEEKARDEQRRKDEIYPYPVSYRDKSQKDNYEERTREEQRRRALQKRKENSPQNFHCTRRAGAAMSNSNNRFFPIFEQDGGAVKPPLICIAATMLRWGLIHPEAIGTAPILQMMKMACKSISKRPKGRCQPTKQARDTSPTPTLMHSKHAGLGDHQQRLIRLGDQRLVQLSRRSSGTCAGK
jgi:hypothetical protein